jgi:hypothetical protein
MTKTFVFALLLSALTFSETQAQSPIDGRTDARAYVNSYFHFIYAWPDILQPYDTGALSLGPGSPYGNEFLLFAAREGDKPYGIVMLAERLNYPTPHLPQGIRDSADFLDRFVHFRPDEHVTNISKKHFTSANGLAFDEVDYMQNGGYSAGVVTTIGKFLIVVKCNAKSTSELAEMTKSVAGIQVQR